jgi:hypothetical protein
MTDEATPAPGAPAPNEAPAEAPDDTAAGQPDVEQTQEEVERAYREALGGGRADGLNDEAAPAFPPPAPEAPESESDDPGLLSSRDVADYLLEPDGELTPEEEAYLSQLEVERQLQSGEAVEALASDQAAYAEAIQTLCAENPGIESQEAMDAMEPIWQGIRARYGDEVAQHPLILKQCFDAVGGSEEFAIDPLTAAYEQALGAGAQLGDDGLGGGLGHTAP